MSENVLHLNRDNFEQTIQSSEKLIVVDFWAPWCGPCKMLGPILEELATEMKESILVCKVNVEEDGNRELAAKFNVSGIPALFFLKNGSVVGQSVGMITKSSLSSKLHPLL